MKRCWNFNPLKRPSIKEICEKINQWLFNNENDEDFKQSEKRRLESIQSMKLGPEFNEKSHSEAFLQVIHWFLNHHLLIHHQQFHLIQKRVYIEYFLN